MNAIDILSMYGVNNRLLGMHREQAVLAKDDSAAFFEAHENVEFYMQEVGKAEVQLVELGLMYAEDACYIEYAGGRS